MAQRMQDPKTAAINKMIGPRIRLFRKQNTEMSGKEFARALGVSPGAISMIERGERGMKKALLPKAAELLKCSLMVLTDPRDLPDEKLLLYNNFMMLLDNSERVDSYPLLETYINSEASKLKSKM